MVGKAAAVEQPVDRVVKVEAWVAETATRLVAVARRPEGVAVNQRVVVVQKWAMVAVLVRERAVEACAAALAA